MVAEIVGATRQALGMASSQGEKAAAAADAFEAHLDLAVAAGWSYVNALTFQSFWEVRHTGFVQSAWRLHAPSDASVLCAHTAAQRFACCVVLACCMLHAVAHGSGKLSNVCATCRLFRAHQPQASSRCAHWRCCMGSHA